MGTKHLPLGEDVGFILGHDPGTKEQRHIPPHGWRVKGTKQKKGTKGQRDKDAKGKDKKEIFCFVPLCLCAYAPSFALPLCAFVPRT
jgi:hypothetical protein